MSVCSRGQEVLAYLWWYRLATPQSVQLHSFVLSSPLPRLGHELNPNNVRGLPRPFLESLEHNSDTKQKTTTHVELTSNVLQLTTRKKFMKNHFMLFLLEVTNR